MKNFNFKFIAALFVLGIFMLSILLLGGCKLEKSSDSSGKSETASETTEKASETAKAPVKTVKKPIADTTAGTTEKAVQAEETAEPEVVESAEDEVESSDSSSSELTTGDFSDERVKGLVERNKKIKSYSFYYSTSDNWDLLRDQYFIKGNNIKVKLYEPSMWNKEDYFDTIYLDTVTKSAVGYCESDSRDRCTNRNKPFDIEYADYKIKTPSDWINSIPYSAKWVGGETFDNRPADKIEYTREDGAIVRISADSYAGVPILVEVYLGDIENIIERYGFRDLTINTVTDMELRLASD